MKLNIRFTETGEEESVTIICNQNRDLSKIIEAVNEINQANERMKKIQGSLDNRIYFIDAENVLYFESVDNRVFMYTISAVYEVTKKLYELEETLSYLDIIRINKSQILNLKHVLCIIPSFYSGGRITVELDNRERLIISRQYAPEFNRRIGMDS